MMRDQATGTERSAAHSTAALGWVELARGLICLLLLAALVFISIRTFNTVHDANDLIATGATVQAVAASGAKTMAYLEGGFQALIAVSAAVALYVGTRVYD